MKETVKRKEGGRTRAERRYARKREGETKKRQISKRRRRQRKKPIRGQRGEGEGQDRKKISEKEE